MSLKLAEARERAGVLSQVSYAVELDLRDEGFYGSTTTVRFRTGVPSTFLELAGGQDPAVAVSGRGRAAYVDGRIELTGLDVDVPNEIRVDARLPYTTGGDGMNMFVDSADGLRYLGAYLGMDLTQRVFACFDQPDIKATVELSVLADGDSTVLANGRLTGRDGERWSFARTPPIPVNQFVVCAGPWESRTFEHAGLPFGWHARRSLASELDRDLADLQAVTTACFDHYTAMFEERYAFDSYDQVFVPGQNWGAQETPGCVMFRDEMLPRAQISATERTTRATVIAHEMAHMWFGNLVTMRWYEDIWLNESFADYMGYRVAADAAGYHGALLTFESGRKVAAYDADSRGSTHPVAPRAQGVPDVDAAFANFDDISYAKGNAVLRQLATWLGDESFLAGVNTYFRRHRFGNATLEDFLAALDESTDRDVRAWSEVWLQRTGFDTIRVERDGEVPVISRDGIREHQITVGGYDDSLREVHRRVVDLRSEPVRLQDFAGRFVLPNVAGQTYARIRPDATSWAALWNGVSQLADPLARARLWASAWEMVRSGQLSLADYLHAVATQLPAETRAAIVGAVLGRTTGRLLRHVVPTAQAAAVRDLVALACLHGLDRPARPEVRTALTAGLGRTSRDAELLQSWVAGVRNGWDEPLTPALRWTAAARLAEIGSAPESLIAELEQRDASSEGVLGAATARAALPDASAKATAWAAMVGDRAVSNRMFLALADGLWSPEQADLLQGYVTAYFHIGPRIARVRGQSFAHLVGAAFPALRLSEPQVALLRDALEGDLHPVLRRAWADELDDLTVGATAAVTVDARR